SIIFNLPSSGCRGRFSRGSFGLDRDFLAFEVAVPAFSVFDFVVLSAHNSLLCSRVAVLWCAI
ncbi:MAG TPA: hypothetical protein VF430_06660, partial [Verrucomicrobiae bacterium]